MQTKVKKSDVDPFIITASGRRFHILRPRASEVCINDIAHSLSRQCRFTGHTAKHLSVAEHSLIVSKILPQDNQYLRLIGLLHDATEAYLGDVSSPLKQLLPDYKAIEAPVWDAIAERFLLPRKLSREIKEADFIALLTEASVLLPGADIKEWAALGKYGPVVEEYGNLPTHLVKGYEPEVAETLFLREYEKLAGVSVV